MAAAQKLDLYKLHRTEYVTPKVPVFLRIKPAKYVTINGKGSPASEVFQTKVGSLYGVAFTIKMARKAAGQDYSVCKLEGLWWGARDESNFSADPPDTWNWKVLIRVPDSIKEKDLKDAIKALREKGKPPEVAEVQLETLDEGQCVQILHVGPYSTEGVSIGKMMALAKEKSLRFRGRHHEIYLSDPRRVASAKLRTILRHPVG